MNERFATILGLIGLVLVATGAVAAYQWHRDSYAIPEPVTPAPATPEIQPFGKVTLALGETAQFEGISIRPIELIEDSRCPINALCIQTGTVRVKLEVVSGLGTSTNTIELNKEVTTEAETVSFLLAEPSRVADETVNSEDYRFTFSVEKRAEAQIPTPPGKCYVGGCSSQICSDQPDAVSTCEYREEYACYQTAACERQASGQCGWTMTQELSMCLAGH